MKAKKLIKAFTVLCLVLFVSTSALATLLDPPSVSTTFTGHACSLEPYEWCSTKLDAMVQVGSPGSTNPFRTLMGPGTPYANWTVTYGGALTGKIHVTTYDAHLCDAVNLPQGWVAGDPFTRRSNTHCTHGAELCMWYEPNKATDPNIPGQDFHWIQRFYDWGGYCGYTTAPHDIIDCTLGPYYYDPGEVNNIVATGHPAIWYLDAPESGCWYDGDRPASSCLADKCPGPCYWGADVWTYLAYGTPGANGTGTMHIYDGIQWGFDAKCVPEPATVLLLGLGSLALLRRRR
jgi:hypothetical protein